MSDSENIEKIKSIKFSKSLHEINNINYFYIIFQRFNKFKYLTLLCSDREYISKNNDEDDIIIFSRKDKLEKNDIIIEDIESVKVITDLEFKFACMDASNLSHKFARFFLLVEFITKFCDLFLIVVLPLSNELNFSKIDIVIIISILIPVILMQVICDWGQLLEKYSRLCWEFSKLKNSKLENRIAEYEKLVYYFKSSWIYTDMIVPIEEI